jgi:hypothetical protein
MVFDAHWGIIPGMPLLRLLFGLPDSPIDRRTYVTVGASLMVFKYIVDAVVIALAAGVFWTPVDYLLPMITFKAAKVAQFPQGLSIWLVLWTLPFIWIGVVLSVRRALDAGIFPGVVVAFFVPFLNYLLMAGLAIAPANHKPLVRLVEPPPSEPPTPLSRSTQLGVVLGAGAGILVIGIGVMGFRNYGISVFLGVPFMTGLVSAVVANRIAPRSRTETIVLGQGALLLIAGMLLLVALEGGICLAMAFPIASPIAIMGSIVGRLLAHRDQPPSFTHITVLLLAVSLGSGIEAAMPGVPTRVVLTSVEIDASPSRVWEQVVSFREIDRAPAWYFRTGLAYPLRARLEGTGVGAVRHCQFTTGTFVEPITVWDEPRVLAFDVKSQPPPLHEWSPYARVFAPHLDGFFRTTHGEFRLIQLAPNRTRLEGRTWYSLEMQPSIYWNAIADTILHAIHGRVLEHVKAAAEKPVPNR